MLSDCSASFTVRCKIQLNQHLAVFERHNHARAVHLYVNLKITEM